MMISIRPVSTSFSLQSTTAPWCYLSQARRERCVFDDLRSLPAVLRLTMFLSAVVAHLFWVQPFTNRADSHAVLNAAEIAHKRNGTLVSLDFARDVAKLMGNKESAVYSYVSKVQAMQRGRTCRRMRETKRLEKAANKIQAVHRGNLTRRLLNRTDRTKGLRDIQNRLQKASKKATSSFFRKKVGGGATASTTKPTDLVPRSTAFIPTDDYNMTLDREITITHGWL